MQSGTTVVENTCLMVPQMTRRAGQSNGSGAEVSLYDETATNPARSARHPGQESSGEPRPRAPCKLGFFTSVSSNATWSSGLSK